jgi:Ni/Co efflux regulator RcnB
MKQIFTVALALSLLSGTAAMAQPNFQGRGGPDHYDQYRNDPGVRMSSPRFSRGDRVPEQYRRDHRYVVDDWQSRHLRRPPRGYHWVRDDNDNYFLAAVTTGLILDLMLNSR